MPAPTSESEAKAALESLVHGVVTAVYANLAGGLIRVTVEHPNTEQPVHVTLRAVIFNPAWQLDVHGQRLTTEVRAAIYATLEDDEPLEVHHDDGTTPGGDPGADR